MVIKILALKSLLTCHYEGGNIPADVVYSSCHIQTRAEMRRAEWFFETTHVIYRWVVIFILFIKGTHSVSGEMKGTF